MYLYFNVRKYYVQTEEYMYLFSMSSYTYIVRIVSAGWGGGNINKCFYGNY